MNGKKIKLSDTLCRQADEKIETVEKIVAWEMLSARDGF